MNSFGGRNHNSLFVVCLENFNIEYLETYILSDSMFYTHALHFFKTNELNKTKS